MAIAVFGGAPFKAVAVMAAALLFASVPAHAGSARTALGVAAGVVLGAAVLGAMAGAGRAHATPRPAKPRKSATRSRNNTSKKATAEKSSAGRAAQVSANDDPFAKPSSETVPVSTKP